MLRQRNREPCSETTGIGTIGNELTAQLPMKPWTMDRMHELWSSHLVMLIYTRIFKVSSEANRARIPGGSAMFAVLFTRGKEVSLEWTKLSHLCAMPYAPGHPMNAYEIICVDEKIEKRTLGMRELCFAVYFNPDLRIASVVSPSFSQLLEACLWSLPIQISQASQEEPWSYWGLDKKRLDFIGLKISNHKRSIDLRWISGHLTC